MTLPPGPHPRLPCPAYEPPERPGRVTAAAVILFVSAGLVMLACCGLNVVAGQAGLVGDEQTLLILLSTVFVVVAGLNVVLGSFILQGRQWARVTTIVLCAVSILFSVLTVVAGVGAAGNGVVSGCLGAVLNAVVIGLLTGEQADDYFASGPG